MNRLIARFKRAPDFVIGDPADPYLRRWWLIPRNRWFNIYLHHFCRSDDDRALHDHPWVWCSIILRGQYWEHTPEGAFLRKAWRPRFGLPTQLHRVQLQSKFELFSWGFANGISCKYIELPVWTLFITGPRVREWGFACPNGWRHWRVFTGVSAGAQRGDERGLGCD